MPAYLKGLGLQRFRGIGDKPQLMAPFKEFNLFIGANNAGKSTVLNFISRFLPTSKSAKPDPLDFFSGAGTGALTVRLGIPTDEAFQGTLEKLKSRPAIAEERLRKVCEFLSDRGMVWFESEIPVQRNLEPVVASLPQLRGLFANNDWRQLWNSFHPSASGGSLDQHWIPGVLEGIRDSQNFSLPPTKLIPAMRQIGPKSEGFGDYTGRGLIDRLAELQNPDHNKWHERGLFDRINSFLAEVTSRPEAKIEIPASREHVLVHLNNRRLPLSSLGTGIEEVVMIAAFCTISENEIVCIEEPELHLHPLLQRKLLHYLRTETENQYFIATHSAAFIDSSEAAIFHVRLDGGQTQITESILRSERFAICEDLGQKASDILQSNAIVWVEGPSDRIYIKHWIATLAPELVEGLHYSIMFYGGRSLSHLTAEDDAVSEFIGLRALNKYAAIVIDSDKRDASDSIGETKKRIVKEFDESGGVSWVTLGREIENYIDHEALQAAVKKVHPRIYGQPHLDGQYDDVLAFKRAKPDKEGNAIYSDVDKVSVAKIAIENELGLDSLDLREKVSELVALIKRANEKGA